MTIEKRTEWGWSAPLPGGSPVVATDAELRAHIETHRRRGIDPPPAGVVGGDMWTTVGAPPGGAERLAGPLARTAPIDVVSVLLDGRQFWFASHMVVRRSWWRGPLVVILNAEWLGTWDLGPRTHPNDGRIDIYETNMALAERVKAWRRLPTGSHLPHPDIAVRRVRAHQTSFDRPMDVWLDGEKSGRHRDITLRVEPDAMLIVY